MKISELRIKNDQELQKELESLLKAKLNLRIQRATQQLTNNSQFSKIKKSIARIKTLKNERMVK